MVHQYLITLSPSNTPGDQHSNRADYKICCGVYDWESGFVGKGGKQPEQRCHNCRGRPEEFHILSSQDADRNGDRWVYHKEQQKGHQHSGIGLYGLYRNQRKDQHKEYNQCKDNDATFYSAHIGTPFGCGFIFLGYKIRYRFWRVPTNQSKQYNP